jgi:hypothetical protein
MKYICTLSDKGFLRQGLCLYKSLKETSSDEFTFYYLCLDDQSFDCLNALSLPGIIPMKASCFVEKDNILKEILHGKRVRSTYSSYWEFCWTLASYLSDNLLNELNLPHIYHIDADILFYQDIDLIQKEIAERDVGIFRHRMFSLDLQRPEGLFNVGVVYFKNSDVGKKLCNWWKDAVLHRKYPEYATCSDQKYLEGFYTLTDSNNIYADDNIGHGAPWHWTIYNCDELDKGYIIWNEKKQPFVFSHFSSFKYDLSKNTYLCSTRHAGWTNGDTIFNHPKIAKLHNDYFNSIKWVEENWTKGKI